MSTKLLLEKRTLFLRILLTLFLCIAITLLISSLVLYKNFESVAQSQVYEQDMDRLLLTRRGVDSMVQVAITLSNQIFRDLAVSQLMYYADPGGSAIRAADDQLTSYRLSIPFIDSVYVYNGVNDNIYINSVINKNMYRDTIQQADKFDDPYAYKMIQQYYRYKSYQPIPRILTLGGQARDIRRYYTFLIYDSLAGDRINSAVVVNISEAWISDFINTEDQVPASTILIVDSDGRTVSQNDRFDMLTNLSGEDWMSDISAYGNDSGVLLRPIDGQQNLITFSAIDKRGWRYIKLTPARAVFARIREMRNISLFISLAILLVGILVSFFVSRRLYNPIREIMRDFSGLQAEKLRHLIPLRNAFFRDILLERKYFSDSELEEKLRELEIPFELSGYFRVVLLKIDRNVQFADSFSPEERGRIKKAILDLYQNPENREDPVLGLEIGVEGIVIIFNTADDIGKYLTESREAIIQDHGLSISFAVSSMEKTVRSLSTLYKEVVECARYRFFYGYGSLLFAEDIELYQNEPYAYPQHLEKQLVQSLMSGHYDESKAQFDEILTGISEKYPIDIFSMTLSRLSFSINDAIRTICRNNALENGQEYIVSMKQLEQSEIYDEVRDLYFCAFDSIREAVQDRKSNRVDNLIDQINHIIDERYGERDFYIETIADELNRSATYICHIYKQNTGSTILDTITNVRMAKAREFLKDTHYSISEVAETTGFSSSSYFYKVFKKIHGSTPSAYRLQINKSREDYTIEI